MLKNIVLVDKVMDSVVDIVEIQENITVVYKADKVV